MQVACEMTERSSQTTTTLLFAANVTLPRPYIILGALHSTAIVDI